MQLGLTARPGTGMHDFHIHDTANKPYSGSRGAQRDQAAGTGNASSTQRMGNAFSEQVAQREQADASGRDQAEISEHAALSLVLLCSEHAAGSKKRRMRGAGWQ